MFSFSLRARFTLGTVLALGGLGCSSETTPVTAASSTMVFVDEAAAPGGDGTQARPFRTIREALEIGRPIQAVAVAAGHYPAPASWDFASALTIFGYAAEPTLLEAEAPATALGWTASAKLVLRNLTLAAPLSLSGGQLELYQLAGTSLVGPALSLSDVTSVVYGLTLSGVLPPGAEPTAGDGVVVAGGSLRWTGGTVADVPDRAVVLTGVDAELDSLTLASSARAPLTVGAGSDVTARNLQIADVSMGVFVESASLRLEQASIDHASTAAVMAAAESTTRIVGSTFTDCPNGHVSVQGSGASMTIESSTLSGASQGPCVFASSTAGAIVVRDSTVHGCAGSGITFFVVTDAIADGNEVFDIGPDPIFPELADGISVQSGTARVTHNHVHDTLGYGLALNQSHVLADFNDIGPTGSSGVAVVDPGVGPTTINDNTISQATGAGVIVLGADVQVLSNTISGTAYLPAEGFGDGVAFGQGAHVAVQDNTLEGNDRNGVVFLDGATGTIAANLATGNAGYGILEFCTGAANAVVIGTNQLDGNGLGSQSLCSP